MEQNQINLTDLNIHELKALAFDEYVKINISNNNLSVLNQELSKRQQAGVADAEPVYSQQQPQQLLNHMEKKLSDLTVVELKSLAYDELAKLETAQQNLRVLNQEINKRFQEQQQTQQGTFTSPTL